MAAKCQSAHAQTDGSSQDNASRMETSLSPRTPTRTPIRNHLHTSATTLFRSRPPFTDSSQALPISPVPFNA
jgi:hypothetical protein